MATNQKPVSGGVQPQQSNVQSNDLVGSLLSLITKAQVRYEGTLVEVDKQERTMNLKQVKSYGTEGRRGGVNEVPPNDNVYPEVTFKVDLIKDFKIVKKAGEDEKPKEEAEEDPAIVSAMKADTEKKEEESKA